MDESPPLEGHRLSRAAGRLDCRAPDLLRDLHQHQPLEHAAAAARFGDEEDIDPGGRSGRRTR